MTRTGWQWFLKNFLFPGPPYPKTGWRFTMNPGLLMQSGYKAKILVFRCRVSQFSAYAPYARDTAFRKTVQIPAVSRLVFSTPKQTSDRK